MWKLIAAIILIVIIAVAIGIGFGFGNGRGDGDGDGDASEKEKQEQVDKEYYEGAIFPVTVMENEYFYNNNRIALEEFLALLAEVEEEVVVEINDDNASLKAYNRLVDELKKQKISYVERKQN